MPKTKTGGRRAGGGGGGGERVTIYSETDMMSARKKNDITRQAAEEAYSVAMEVERRYGFALPGHVVVSDIGRSKAMAYYDSQGNIGVNQKYFNAETMNAAYDRCVTAGFHPPRGNYTGTEAVVAHEYGHALSGAVAEKMGINTKGALHIASDRIVQEAMKLTKHGTDATFKAAISGYAQHSSAEAVAEAFADNYCNGNNARAESKAIMQILNKYL